MSDYIQIENNKTAIDVMPTSIGGLELETNIVCWNMRGNRRDRWSLFLERLPSRDSIDIALLQETHMHANAMCQLKHPDFMFFRCDTVDDGDSSCPDDQQRMLGKHGVAIAIRHSYIMPGTVPSIVCAGEARLIVVDFTDRLGQLRRVASIYFPAKDKKERVQFMTRLPWSVLASAIIGCDSNLRSSVMDKYPLRNERVREDGREFLNRIEQHGLFDMWDLEGSRPATFMRNGVDTSCIDRLLMPTTMLLSSKVAHIYADANLSDLSDHKPLMVTLGSFACNSLPRIIRRVPTALLLADKALLARARSIAHDAVQRLGTSSPVVIWQKTIERIAFVLYAANDALVESRSRKRCANLKRKQRRLRMRLVCIEAEIAAATKAVTEGGRPSPSFNLKRISKERAELSIAANRVQVSAMMLEKRLRDDMQREADELRFETGPSNTGRIAKALKDADDTPARITVARRDSPGSPLVSKPEEVNEIMTEFWSNLRSTPAAVDDEAMHEVLSCVPRSESSAMLSADLGLSDIEAAIKRARVSAPGCDRMDIVLFRTIPELAKLLHAIWNDRKQHGIPSEWRRSFVTLLPKAGAADSARAGSYRPISVDCVAFRLICSAIQTNSAVWLDAMINDEQRAFVRCFNTHDDQSSSRNILDGIAEVLGAANNATRCGTPLALVFFDFVKAYDSISREYLFGALDAMGCTASFVDDMRFILRDCVSQIVVNGHVGRAFDIGTGVAQGNPLSCFLYIAAVSAIPALARKMGVVGFKPTLPATSAACLRGGVPVLVCNQFVDNLVGLASIGDVERWFRVMAKFKAATGQRCNEEATRIVCVGDVQALVPVSRQHLVVTGAQSVRLLGVYVSASGAVHSDTWERRLASMQVALRKLDRLHVMRDLRSRATAVRVFVLPTLLYVASVVAIPDDTIADVQRMTTAFIFNDSAIHPSVDVVSEAAVDGGLTANGGAACFDRLIQSLVARRFVSFLCERTRRIDDWLWLDAQCEYQQVFRTLWSSMSSPPQSFGVDGALYNPNAYAHSQATRNRIWHSVDHASPLSAKALILEPVAGNVRFGARLSAGVVGFPRVSAFHRASGRDVYVAPGRRDTLYAAWHCVVDEWPALAAALACGVSQVADVAYGSLVSLRLDDASSSVRHHHGRVGFVTHVTRARDVCSVQLFPRLPWQPEHGPLLVSSLGAMTAVAVRVPAAACHALVKSANGLRLFRSDDRVFDHRQLRIPHDSTSSDNATTLALADVGGTSSLDHWRRDRFRFEREQASLGVPRLHTPVSVATAADLFRRVRALSRSKDHASQMVVRGQRHSFADLLRVPLPTPVFDFVWRVRHEALPFMSWMRLPSVGDASVSQCLVKCPDCGIAIDDKIHNDHVTLDCPGGLVPAVRRALGEWLKCVLSGPSLVDAFDKAWTWQLRPSNRKAAKFVAIMVAAIAKHRVWLHFTARVFADASDPFRMSRGMPLALGVEAEEAVVKECKRDLRLFLRRLQKLKPSVFSLINSVVGPLWADEVAES